MPTLRHIKHTFKPRYLSGKAGNSLAFLILATLVLPCADAAEDTEDDVVGHSDALNNSAAHLDWVIRSNLPESALRNIEPYCPGTYVEPSYGFTALDAQSQNGPAPEDAPEGQLKARADRLHASEDGKVALTGNVRVAQGPWWLEADGMTLDRRVNEARIEGDIVARAPGMLMRGREAKYTLEDAFFSLEDASYLIHARHARGDAELIQSMDTSRMVITDGSYTACPPGVNSWEVKAGSIELDRVAGEGRATNMRLNVKGVPVFYFPYLVFPIDDRRKSGFLYPSLGTSNTGSGIALSVPYYFNLAPNYDATLAPQYIHGRGLLTEVEGRHMSRKTYAELRVGYIANDKEYVNLNPEDDGSRWGLDFDHLAQPLPALKSEIDYNAVSDNEYLNDLNRSLEIQQETHLRRSWKTAYQRDNWRFESRFLGFQTIDDDIAAADRPYYMLPELRALWFREQGVFNLGFTTEATYFWRDDQDLAIEDDVTGLRWRSQPEVELELANAWGYLKPALRLDHTDYFLQEDDNGLDGHISRSIPFFRIDSGIFLERQTEMFDNLYLHSLEPRLFYVHSPFQAQSDIPDFSTSVTTFSYSRLFQEDRFVGGDRIGDNNRLTLGFTTRFNESRTGTEKFRASIGQIFYFDDSEVTLEEEGQVDDGASPIAGELIWQPLDRIDLKVEGQWDIDDNFTRRGATTFSYHGENYQKIINLSHRYLRDDIEQTEVSGLYPLTDSVSVLGRWLFDLRKHRTIGTIAGLEYNSCCWRVQLISRSYLEDSDDDGGESSQLEHGIFLRFQLRGLGGLGSGVEAVMSDELNHFSEREAYLTERYAW